MTATPRAGDGPQTALTALASAGLLPDHQFMDAPTLDRIAAARPAGLPAPRLPYRLPPPLIPLGEWFVHPRQADSLHGVLHNSRVATLATILARTHGLTPAEQRTLAVAAAVHDCRRHNDRDDPHHGRRAADWLDRHHRDITAHLAPGPGAADDEPAALRQGAVTAVALHDVPYAAFTREQTSAYGRARLFTDLLKTADALDRYRLPCTRWWPNPALLQVVPPDWLHAVAFDLVLHSERARLDGADPHQALTHAHTLVAHGPAHAHAHAHAHAR
ncbi:hypothetical protein [Streptomyces sp. NPDC051211]|uniref:hypothetical protein n=1 Tax=Streptomyces sp. NPDC051211 TaxID=3154643 RepID=UPI003450EB53